MKVDLMPLELYDFDLILGMDWLSRYRAQVDCFTKIVTIQGKGGRMVEFKGERKLILNTFISVMMAKKLIRKGCLLLG